MTEDRLKELRDQLFRATEGYDGDGSIRATASALSSLIIGCTADRTAALAALERYTGPSITERGFLKDRRPGRKLASSASSFMGLCRIAAALPNGSDTSASPVATTTRIPLSQSRSIKL
jgi:hypothetical protein